MKLSFERIAIVNRGEPAMRLIHAVNEYNAEHGTDLKTIALYTTPDSSSLFVRKADEAFCIGEALFVDARDGQRKSSYLDYERLKNALLATRAEAVWVGWGFVAEHPEFAEMCKNMGVVFIGPSPSVMRKLGDKIESKRVAEEAGVPVSPWSNGAVSTLEDAKAWAQKIGFPLMVKATAGGGGRGIRKVTSMEGLSEAFQSARSEALKGFGDDTVFMEKMISNARHIEVQIIADTHGNVWAAGVRDCSVQRRNQKVIEEAPCPSLTKAQEKSLKEAACRLAKTAGYTNAGTVECLFQQETGEYFFMEVNTRLQVEHPVTEMTTGIDLVKLQLWVASGGMLEGNAPETTGCAIEVRLNAEDPDNGFAPAPGKAVHFRLPNGPGIRIDTGIEEGDSIAPDFDSMIAKIIAFGRNRDEAIARLRRALSECTVVIDGGGSNKSFLLELLSHPDVQQSKIDIGWLDRLNVARASHKGERQNAALALIAGAIASYKTAAGGERALFLTGSARGRPVVDEKLGRDLDIQYAGESYKMHTRQISETAWQVSCDESTVLVECGEFSEYDGWISVNGLRHRLLVVSHGVQLLVEVDGVPHRISSDDGGLVRAPASSIVLSSLVQPGDIVEEGSRLIVLEAMKMETSVLSPCAGRVKAVLVRSNTQVDAGAPLIALEPLQAQGALSINKRVSFVSLSQSSLQTQNRELFIHLLENAIKGYDVCAKDLVATLQKTSFDPLFEDVENKLFAHFANVLFLYGKKAFDGRDVLKGSEEWLLTYLRSPEFEASDLPEPFTLQLKSVLAHYGIQKLTRTQKLEQSLVLVHKTFRRAEGIAGVLSRMLEQRMEWCVASGNGRTERFREILDALALASADRFPLLQEMATLVRYHIFNQALYLADYTKAMRAVDSDLANLGRETPEKKQAFVENLLESAYPIAAHLTTHMESQKCAQACAVLEILLRQAYRDKRFAPFQSHCEGVSFVESVVQSENRSCCIAATHCSLENLHEVLGFAFHMLLKNRSQERILEIFCRAAELPENEDTFAFEVVSMLNSMGGGKLSATTLNLTLAWSGQEIYSRTFTFRTDKHNQFVEDAVARGLHPVEAERFELWRLAQFQLQRIDTAQHEVRVLAATSRENLKDKRLFAYAEVRSLQPSTDEAGRFAGLPHFESVFLQACAALRSALVRMPPRERPLWNRIVLRVTPVMTGEQRHFLLIAKKLQPFASQLGLEKVVIRGRVFHPGNNRVDNVAIDITNNFDAGMQVSFARPSGGLVPTLTPFQQKAIQMRARGGIHPFEIVRMLTPSTTDAHSTIPKGEFQEYDLVENALRPVKREFAQNTANIVVGRIKNYTAKFPEGMERVIILGDASKDMGALSEAECQRIILALDMAEANRIPVEWFSVSSGAKIAMDSGTENLDSTAAVLRRIIQFTQNGGALHVIVSGINVGAQAYWNAEATMLMHTRGILVMTPDASLVLTGKRALDFSGSVSAEDNQGIGGAERIMAPNGQCQYFAKNLLGACEILMQYYAHSYVYPGELWPRSQPTQDSRIRDISLAPHPTTNGMVFEKVGDIFSPEKNPGRKKPFDMRAVMAAVVDSDSVPLERWNNWRDAETGIVWDAHLGGRPVCLLGIESRPLNRYGFVPGDGPKQWMGGTLFPKSSKKLARAINSASGNRPIVVLANLSGFDGSPESMRKLQLEYGAELGRAVVNCQSPIVFCVLSRFHGGAYVVFSSMLTDGIEVAAVEGAYASVIGGTPAAAVVFPGEVKARTHADPRVSQSLERMARLEKREKAKAMALHDELYKTVYLEKQTQVAEEFDAIHSIQRAIDVGSVHACVQPSQIRAYLIDALARKLGEQE
jgi:acetyl/propionyl-CoA carboxylase alpha subunit/acetyl-CoA carboxylase carboxyltransferase component